MRAAPDSGTPRPVLPRGRPASAHFRALLLRAWMLAKKSFAIRIDFATRAATQCLQRAMPNAGRRPERSRSVMAGKARALPAARAEGNVNGRFVPRSARCILIARPAMAGIFLRARGGATPDTSALQAPRAPGFFSNCASHFADVRCNCLLRTGEPCNPGRETFRPGIFLHAWRLAIRPTGVCDGRLARRHRNGAAREGI